MDWLLSDPGQSGPVNGRKTDWRNHVAVGPQDSGTECVLAVTQVKNGASRRSVVLLDPELVWEGGGGVK